MDCQKHLFSLPEDRHYINCSYLSPLLKSAEQAGIEGIKSKNRPWETTPGKFFDDSDTLRSLFSKLINAPASDDVAILPAVSYGLAIVAKNIDPKKGETIVVAGEQFPSNVYVWKRFCEEHDCRLNIVKPPEGFEGRGEQWNRRILEAIGPDTLLVALGNVHWTDGTRFDLEAIGAKARDNDAYLAVDGTQSVGAMPFDIQKVQPDALICAGYKWLMGPYSMTMGYFSPRLQNGVPLEEGWIVRKDSEDFSGLVDYADGYQPGARRFDVGERSNFILVPMMIAALQQVLQWKPENIQQYCRELTADFIRKLPEHGYRIEDSSWRGEHMFGVRLPEHIRTDVLQERLAERNIYLSIRGSAIRISPNVYNDREDMEALMEVLCSF